MLLSIHILVATLSIVSATIGLIGSGSISLLAQKLFKPSVILVLLSGASLVVAGGSLLRSCLSGSLLVGFLYIVRHFSKRNILKQVFK